MKKTALAVVLGTLAFSTAASASWYAEGNLGYSKLKTSGLEVKEFNDSTFSPSLAVGYKINDWRFAVDYTYYGKADQGYAVTYSGGSVKGSSELKAHGLGVSAFYDFDLHTALKPYVGVRLAANHVKVEENYIETATGSKARDSDSDSKTELGYGAVIGATYNFAPKWDLNVAAEYNRVAKVEDIKINQYGAKVGVRYTF